MLASAACLWFENTDAVVHPPLPAGQLKSFKHLVSTPQAAHFIPVKNILLILFREIIVVYM
jgi:hypothetical protein